MNIGSCGYQAWTIPLSILPIAHTCIANPLTWSPSMQMLCRNLPCLPRIKMDPRLYINSTNCGQVSRAASRLLLWLRLDCYSIAIIAPLCYLRETFQVTRRRAIWKELSSVCHLFQTDRSISPSLVLERAKPAILYVLAIKKAFVEANSV